MLRFFASLKAPTLLALCLLLSAFSLRTPGPVLVNGYAPGVDLEVKLTDGTVRTDTLTPCSPYWAVPRGVSQMRRTVFVERVTFHKDGALLGVHEGAKVEALGALGGYAVLGESGLRRVARLRCSLVFNKTGEPLQVVGHYKDGGTASVTMTHHEPLVWTSVDLASPHDGGCRLRRWWRCKNQTRLAIAQGGTVIHDLDARAIRKTFKRHMRYGFSQLAIGRTKIESVRACNPIAPKPCVAGPRD